MQHYWQSVASDIARSQRKTEKLIRETEKDLKACGLSDALSDTFSMEVFLYLRFENFYPYLQLSLYL
jgi:hypothetical protein